MLDELEEYLRGGSELSRRYKRESISMPPQALDRTVRAKARGIARKSQCLAPLAFAASLLISVALVLAIVFAPQRVRAPQPAHVVRVNSYNIEAPRAALSPRERNPASWLEYIAVLRHSGRRQEADLELRRFRTAYPSYLTENE